MMIGEVGRLTTAELIERGGVLLASAVETIDPKGCNPHDVLIGLWGNRIGQTVELFECTHGGLDPHWHIMERVA